ncbi:MAG: HPF/RaiA family ribosome-associated protein [Candidatus Pacearchaeota archaeon]
MPEISLRGFDDLDKSEIKTIEDLISSRLRKLNIAYSLLVIELKQHKHEYKHLARIIHEIKIDLFFGKGKPLTAKAEDVNLYKAIGGAMDRLLKEVRHRFKK